MNINFGNVAKNYAQYRNDLPVELFESLRVRGIHFSGKKVVDLGSGTGVLSRAMSKDGATVVGVEPAIELIEEARVIDKRAGLDITYVHNYSDATTLESNAFDYVTVLRAWHWFDRQKTMEEINRVLKEDGTLLVMDSGFISGSKVITDTVEIVKRYMPNGVIKPAGSKADSKQSINSFPVEWFQEWKQNGFDLRETYKFEYTVSFSNEEWCGRIGSLSWLTGFADKIQMEILDELYRHLVKEYGNITHHIQHGCYVTVLHRT